MRLNFQLIYFLSLTLFALSLPLSPFLLSVSQFILLGNWILEGQFKDKWQTFKNRKGLWIFLLFFLLHFSGMAHTSDLFNGLHDLKIKLPLLLLPVVIGTSRPLTEKAINRLLIAFGIATFLSTIICYYNYLKTPMIDVREISVFISHIRLSILVNISIFSFAYLILKYNHMTWIGYKLGGVLIIAWMLFFLNLLQSVTGMMVFVVIIVLISLHLFSLTRSGFIRSGVLLFTVSIIIFLAANLITSIRLFSEYHIENENLKLLTVNGNPYSHDPGNREMEGGNYVWLYVCEEELEQEWNSKSKLEYQGNDLRGQELRTTLIRFLTSKGLGKDSAGLNTLSPAEIKLVENGIASSYYTNRVFPHPRIYQVVWELHSYSRGANPGGLSVAQRIEYWKNAIMIIKSNPIMGVGTGDVQKAFDEFYENNQSALKPEYRLRAHNQFLTFAIALGIPAMLLLLFAFFYPAFSEKRWKLFLPQFIIIIAFISMLNEDTLETQAGVSFFAFFYTLFIFGMENTGKNS
jgi:hypothetical protein